MGEPRSRRHAGVTPSILLLHCFAGLLGLGKRLRSFFVLSSITSHLLKNTRQRRVSRSRYRNPRPRRFRPPAWKIDGRAVQRLSACLYIPGVVKYHEGKEAAAYLARIPRRQHVTRQVSATFCTSIATSFARQLCQELRGFRVSIESAQVSNEEKYPLRARLCLESHRRRTSNAYVGAIKSVVILTNVSPA